MASTFGLIAEGKTDHAVLKNILIGHFNDPDLYVSPLQPTTDATDAAEMQRFGGWTNVLNYCASHHLVEALDANDFLIIHVDTDCTHISPFDVPTIPNEPLESWVKRVQKRLIQQIGADIYALYEHRIVFAIAVEAIECWLLPLHYNNNESKIQAATKNCFYKLQQKNSLIRKDKTIYHRISKDFQKNKILKDSMPKNPSLHLFIRNLMDKVEL